MLHPQHPYADKHRQVLDVLDRLTQAESEALLRRAGILDEAGHLAAKYKAGGDPVSSCSEYGHSLRVDPDHM